MMQQVVRPIDHDLEKNKPVQAEQKQYESDDDIVAVGGQDYHECIHVLRNIANYFNRTIKNGMEEANSMRLEALAMKFDPKEWELLIALFQSIPEKLKGSAMVEALGSMDHACTPPDVTVLKKLLGYESAENPAIEKEEEGTENNPIDVETLAARNAVDQTANPLVVEESNLAATANTETAVHQYHPNCNREQLDSVMTALGDMAACNEQMWDSLSTHLSQLPSSPNKDDFPNKTQEELLRDDLFLKLMFYFSTKHKEFFEEFFDKFSLLVGQEMARKR